MALAKVRLSVSGGAGGSRYAPRAEVKGAAKKRRRAADKNMIRKGE